MSKAKSVAAKIGNIKPKIPSVEFYEIQDSAKVILQIP